MAAVLTELVNIMVGAVTTLGTGVAQGVVAICTALFIDNSGTSMALSIFGGIVAVFAGISLAIGVSKLVYHFIASLGGTGK